MKMNRLLAVASAAFLFAGSAFAQNPGSVTNHAFAIGKGAGTTGFSSVPCTLAQIAVGQTAADPICRTVTGDVTIDAAGVTAIGSGKVTNSMIASMTSAQMAAIISNETGSGLLVFGTSPVLTTPNLGTPSAGTLTNTTGFPTANLAGAGTGVLTFLATPTSANLAAALTNETGSGAAVFATSPTLVTPVLGAATATTINGATVSPGQYSGEPTTGSASAGNIGEYVNSTIIAGSAVALTTGTVANITSISLTAGDWDVWGQIAFAPAGSTNYTLLISGISTTSATLPTTNIGSPGRTDQPCNGSTGCTGGGAYVQPVTPVRVSLSGTTTVYLVADAFFTINTMSGYGFISARRRR